MINNVSAYFYKSNLPKSNLAPSKIRRLIFHGAFILGPLPLLSNLEIMSVRFDPRVISAEEAVRLNAPVSSGLPVGNPDPSRDSQGNPPSSSNAPPRPTESFPQPPSQPPPMRKKKDICTPFRPSIWEISHELVELTWDSLRTQVNPGVLLERS